MAINYRRENDKFRETVLACSKGTQKVFFVAIIKRGQKSLETVYNAVQY